jgi:hypothetical protein
MKYLAIAIAWGFVAVACLSVTQGTYEDHQQMAEYGSLTRTPPALWQARGLLNLSVWAQARTHATPAEMRLGSLALAAIASAFTGVFAWQLGTLRLVRARDHGAASVGRGSRDDHFRARGTDGHDRGAGRVLPCDATVDDRHGVRHDRLYGRRVSGERNGRHRPRACAVDRPDGASPNRAARRHLGLALIVALAWWYRDLGLVDSSRSLTWGLWALHQSAAAFRLVLLSIVPIGQTVDPDIDALAFAWMIGAVAGLVVFAMLTIGLWRTQRIAAFGLAWIAIVMLPRVIVMTPRSYFNEHQWYPALVGVAIVGAAIAGSVEATWAEKI